MGDTVKSNITVYKKQNILAVVREPVARRKKVRLKELSKEHL
jgi:hypothetical protein